MFGHRTCKRLYIQFHLLQSFAWNFYIPHQVKFTSFVRYLGTWLKLMLLCLSQLSSMYKHKITFWSQCQNGGRGICWRLYLVCVSECRSNQHAFLFLLLCSMTAGSLVPQRRCAGPGFSNTQLGKRIKTLDPGVHISPR